MLESPLSAGRLRKVIPARDRAIGGIPRAARLGIILLVVPAACASPTVLDKVLARMVLALEPGNPAELDRIAQTWVASLK